MGRNVTHGGDRITLFNMRAARIALFMSFCLAGLVGCSSDKLETGYQYTPLGATPTQRRAYYAGPFSPEAREAMMNADDGADAPQRRGRPGA
jgi:hypothetical protein